MRGRVESVLVFLLGFVLPLSLVLFLPAGCTLGPAAPDTPAGDIPGTAMAQVQATGTPRPMQQKTATVATPTARESYARQTPMPIEATVTASVEATSQPSPTPPNSWVASTGFWTPEPEADLPNWSSSPILAGETITVGNVADVETLGRWGKGRATALAWSPDGRWLAVGTPAGVYLHDAQTLAEVQSLQVPASVSGLAFSPDGALLAATGGGAVQVWETGTWQQAQELPGGGKRLAFSPDSALLAVASPDSTVVIWQTGSWRKVRVLANAGYEVAFSPDGVLLASSDDTSVRLWDTESWRTTRVLNDHWTGGAYRLAFSPDSALLAQAGTSRVEADCVAEQCSGGCIWTVATGKLFGGLPMSGVFGVGATSVAFSPDGLQIVAGSGYGWVYLLKLDKTGSTERLPAGHLGPVLQVAFSADGARFASLGGDGAVLVWQTTTGQVVNTLDGYLGEIRQVALAAKSDVLAIGASAEAWGEGSSTVVVGRVTTGQALHVWGQQTNTLRKVALSPDGTILAVGGTRLWMVDGPPSISAPQVQLWQLGKGQELWGKVGEDASVHLLSFSPDGTRLAAGLAEGCSPGLDCTWSGVRMWETGSGRELDRLDVRGDFWSTVMSFSPDWSLLAVSFGEHAYFWAVETGQHIADYKQDVLAGIAFSPDGTVFAGITREGAVSLRPVLKEYPVNYLRHAEGVRTAAFSPDGSLIVTGSADGTVQIWETDSGWCLQTLHGHTGAVNSVTFSADGTYFVSGGWDGTVRVWGVPR